MREIKFRGKSIQAGQWFYGDLIQLANGRRFIINNKFGACIDDKGNFVNTGSPFVVEVIPESVGQFTGLTDKNGKEIYEGDILWDKGTIDEYRVVEWVGDVFMAVGDTFSSRIVSFNEVIGNIHENKELLDE